MPETVLCENRLFCESVQNCYVNHGCRCVIVGSWTTRRWRATRRCTRAASTTCVGCVTKALIRSTSCAPTPSVMPTQWPTCTHAPGATRPLTCTALLGVMPGPFTRRPTPARTVERLFRAQTSWSCTACDTRHTASSCVKLVGDSLNARSDICVVFASQLFEPVNQLIFKQIAGLIFGDWSKVQIKFFIRHVVKICTFMLPIYTTRYLPIKKHLQHFLIVTWKGYQIFVAFDVSIPDTNRLFNFPPQSKSVSALAGKCRTSGIWVWRNAAVEQYPKVF